MAVNMVSGKRFRARVVATLFGALLIAPVNGAEKSYHVKWREDPRANRIHYETVCYDQDVSDRVRCRRAAAHLFRDRCNTHTNRVRNLGKRARLEDRRFQEKFCAAKIEFEILRDTPKARNEY